MSEFFVHLREWLEEKTSWKTIAIALLLTSVIAFCGGNLYQEWRADGEGLTLVKEEETIVSEDVATTEADTGEIVVHVTGAVSAPGIYTLPFDSRIDDAVRAAGVTAEADLSQLNLAQKLADGQKITVPSVGETSSAETTSDSEGTATDNSLININSATIEELKELPNIGEARAKAIIAYREEHGSFRTIEELKEVSGIGDKIFADVSTHITV